MRDHVRSVVDLVRLLLVFVTLTVFFYACLVWIANYMDGRPQEPSGRSVKVFQPDERSSWSEWNGWKERFILYYWFGE